MSDDMRLVLFSVFDENRSWYLEENIRRFCTDAAHVDKQDPQFYASNVMHSECKAGRPPLLPAPGKGQLHGSSRSCRTSHPTLSSSY